MSQSCHDHNIQHDLQCEAPKIKFLSLSESKLKTHDAPINAE